MTTKVRLLTAIAGKTVENAEYLVLPAKTDIHNITHVLWAMQKQGLVTFRETRHDSFRRLTDIRLTPKGNKANERVSV